MSRTVKILIGVCLGVVLVVGVAVGGYFGYRERQDRTALRRAEAAMEAKNYSFARLSYAWYLSRNPDDVPILERYAEACSKCLENRASALRDAGKAYLQIATAQPDVADHETRLVEYLHKHRLWPELEYAAIVALRRTPDNSEMKYMKALAVAGQGRDLEAIKLYTELAEEGTTHFDAYGNLASLLLKQRNPQQAERVLSEAQARFPGAPQMGVQLARYRLESRDLEGARQALAGITPDSPLTTSDLLIAASVHRALDEWPEAMAYGRKAVELSPDDPNTHLAVASALSAQAKLDEALGVLEAVRPEVRADSPELFMALTEAQIALGRETDANASIEELKKSYPELTYVVDLLNAKKMLARGQFDEAGDLLDKALLRAPEFLPARYALVLARLQSYEKDRSEKKMLQARAAFDAYLKLNPEDSQAKAIWNSVFEASPDEIRKDALALLQDSFSPTETLVASAKALLPPTGRFRQASDRDLALQLLRRALERQPSNVEAYRLLAELEFDPKDTSATESVLASARSAGIADDDLAVVRARVALAKNNVEEARAIMVAAMTRPDTQANEIGRWVDLFASSNEAATMAQTIAERVDFGQGEKRAALVTGTIALHAVGGDLDKALAALEQYAEKYSDDSALLATLADTRITLARDYLSRGDDAGRTQGMALLEGVEQSHPENASAKVLRAELLLRKSPPDIAGAEALARAASQSDGASPQAHLVLADIYLRKNRTREALEAANRAVHGAPASPGPRLMLARVYLAMSNFNEAKNSVNPVLETNPEHFQALEVMVRADTSLRLFSAARDSLRKMQGLVRGDATRAAMVKSLEGTVLAGEGKYADAERLLRAYLETNPEDSAAAQTLAFCLAGQGKTSETEQSLIKITEDNPSNPSGWVGLGRHYLTQSDPQSLAKASQAFSRALLLSEDYLPAILGMCEVQLRNDNLGAALGLYDRYLAIDPDNSEILYRKATLLAASPERLADALAAIDRTLELDPRPEYRALRGFIELDLKNYEKSIDDLQKSVQGSSIVPPDIEVGMALAHLGLNQYDRARQLYQSAVSKVESGQRLANAVRMEALKKALDERNPS